MVEAISLSQFSMEDRLKEAIGDKTEKSNPAVTFFQADLALGFACLESFTYAS